MEQSVTTIRTLTHIPPKRSTTQPDSVRHHTDAGAADGEDDFRQSPRERELPMNRIPSAEIPLPGSNVDRFAHAQLARLTGGISPEALVMAFEDWFMHLSRNPAQQAELVQGLLQALMEFPGRLQQPPRPAGTLGLDPSLPDRRFTHPSAAFKTELCSMADTITRRSGKARNAQLFASVAELVNTTSRGNADIAPAISARESSTIFLAKRPALCTEEGFAGCSITSSIRALAAGRSGATAL